MIKKYVVLLFLTTFLILGCVQEVGKPEIRGISHKWGNITSSTTEVITTIKVYNPNPIPLPLKDILTEIYMNNIKMGEGSALKAEIKAKSESEIILSTKLENSKIPEWWVSHIKSGEMSTMNIKGYLVFDLKITEFKYPIELSNSIETNILAGLSSDEPRKISVGPVTLIVKSIKSYWGEVNKDYTEIITLATIYNDNPIPVPMIKFHYLVEMNGIRIAEGTSTIDTIIKPKSEETITFITKINNDLLDEWWVSHIKNGERTKVKIVVQPVIKVHGKEFKFTIAEKISEFTTNLLAQ